VLTLVLSLFVGHHVICFQTTRSPHAINHVIHDSGNLGNLLLDKNKNQMENLMHYIYIYISEQHIHKAEQSKPLSQLQDTNKQNTLERIFLDGNLLV
jgi:hypothetical protein